MFYETPHRDLGFPDWQWELMPGGDKRLIRSFVHNGYDETRTILYDEYEDDSRLRKLLQKYEFDLRPRVKVEWTQIHIY